MWRLVYCHQNSSHTDGFRYGLFHSLSATLDRIKRAISGLYGLKRHHAAHAAPPLSRADGDLWLARGRSHLARHRLFCRRRPDVPPGRLAIRSLLCTRHHCDRQCTARPGACGLLSHCDTVATGRHLCPAGVGAIPLRSGFEHGHAHGLVSDGARSRYRHPADGIKPGRRALPAGSGHGH